MKKKLSKIISLFMFAMMLIIGVIPVFAASIGSNSSDINTGQDAVQHVETEYGKFDIGQKVDTNVYMTVDDGDVAVGVPTSVIVSGVSNEDGKNIGEYQVAVSGDMSGDKLVTVKPDSYETQLHQTGKADMPAVISQDKTEFDSDDFSNSVTANGQITAEGLTAGLWNSSFMFEISMKQDTGIISEYLSHNVNIEMLHGSDGYLYVGSRNSVNKMDVVTGEIVSQYKFDRPSTDVSTYVFTGLGENGDYLYACSRVEQAGLTENPNDTSLGDLYVFDKSNMSVVSKTSLSGKGSRILIKNNIMIVACQMYGFDIYDTSNASAPKLIHSYRPEKGTMEYQGGDIYTHNGRTYYAVGAFGYGVYIFDITDTIDSDGATEPNRVGYFNFSRFAVLKTNVHTYDIIADYPYLYVTAASSKVSDFGTEKDIRGLMKVNIEDIIAHTADGTYRDVEYTITQIPDEYKALSNLSGDTKPTRMIRVGNYIIANGGEKGVVIFDISKDTPEFYKFVPTNGVDMNTVCDADDYVIFGAFSRDNPLILVYDKDKIIR